MKTGKNCNIHPTVQIFNGDMIEIGDNTRIDAFCVLSGGSGLKIGGNIHVACGVYLFAGSGIWLADYTQIGCQSVLLSESDDFSGESMIGPQMPKRFKPGYKGGSPIILEKHAVLGARCTVLPGVTLREGAIVGAHSLVKRDLDEWTVYAGTPAKRIKSRSNKVLALEKEFIRRGMWYAYSADFPM